MKEIISKKNNKSEFRLLSKVVFDKNDVISKNYKVIEFHKFSTSIGSELTRKIPTALRSFESFLNKLF